MRTIIFGLIAVLGLSLPAFAHEDLHDFKIYLTVRGAPVVMYEVKQVPNRLADILCDNLRMAVKAWRLAPGTDELVLEGISGKVVLFDKSVIDAVYCSDVTPPKVEKKSTWRLVPHCGRCNQLRYVYVVE